MCKNLLLFFLSFSWVHSYSQDKNLLLIGGGIGAMYSSSSISDLTIQKSGTAMGGFTPTNLIGTYGDNKGDFKTFYINLDQSVLVYLSERLLTGLEFSILKETNKYDSELITESNTVSYLVSPCLRYFIYRGFYGQIQYYLGTSHEKIKSNMKSVPGQTGFHAYDYTSTNKAKANGYGLSAGYLIPVGSNCNIDLSLRYLRNKNKFEYENKNENGTYNLAQNTFLVTVGFKYALKHRMNKQG